MCNCQCCTYQNWGLDRGAGSSSVSKEYAQKAKLRYRRMEREIKDRISKRVHRVDYPFDSLSEIVSELKEHKQRHDLELLAGYYLKHLIEDLEDFMEVYK